MAHCSLVVQWDLQLPQVHVSQQDLQKVVQLMNFHVTVHSYYMPYMCIAFVYSHPVVLRFPSVPLALPLPEGQWDQLDQVVLGGQQDRPSHLFLALHGR